MDLLIPALVRDLSEGRAAFLLPSNYMEYVGSYGDVLSVTAGGTNYPAGMLGGSFSANSMEHIAWYWDEIQDMPATTDQPARTAFRYNDIKAPEYSCFLFSAIGTNGVAYFYKLGDQMYVDVPDTNNWMVPKRA